MAVEMRSCFRLPLVAWLGYVALVAVLSLWPMPPGPQTGHLDKVAHLALYLVMGLAAPWRMSLSRAWPTLLGLAVLGGVLELLQEAMGLGRHGEVLDEAVNVAGAALGLGLRLVLARTRGRAG